MLTSEQARRLSGQRKVVAQERRFVGPAAADLSLRYAQIGLPFTAEHAAYLTLQIVDHNAVGIDCLTALAAKLDERAESEDYRCVAVIAVAVDLWTRWRRETGECLDEKLFAECPQLHRVLQDHQPPYALTPGDLFIHVKSCDRDRPAAWVQEVLAHFRGAVVEVQPGCTYGDSLHDGRIFGGRMLHGLIGAVDPVGLSARAIIGDEFPGHQGGCFGLTQRFVHDWQRLEGMADNEMENLIGRDHLGNIIINDDPRSHIKVVRVNDADGVNYALVGESQPFRGSQPRWGKEDGIFQVAYAKTITAFTKALEGMIGDEKGYIASRHFQVTSATHGGYWYVPSARELKLSAPHEMLTVTMNEFFDARSGNGRLFYNSMDYLHRVGNRVVDLDPHPTDRVVELLNYSFARWHDTWYRRRPAPELEHISKYVTPEEWGRLEKSSIATRKGAATRLTLELLSSEPWGPKFDTYRLHPRELIVGVVPDFTLGSGFEVMRYLTAEEYDEAHVLKVNESGAAGHNVPDYARLLKMGVAGLLEDVERRIESAAGAAQDFYRASADSLKGVLAYLRNYAALARRLCAATPAGLDRDRQSLQTIAERMDRLAQQPPDSFLEAAQLVFSMHCCMHIAGESISIGRLDQLLAPFYDPASPEAAEAQEIIDCFWIKMDEKVLLNYRNFNDRLSRGSGAITYEGGDFPQGAALNQWVQQITVGGSVADDAESPADACNAVTRMCLRAARRLPLNAPCLSLRVHEKMSTDLLAEVAETILSGGAHPFLINDRKITRGLVDAGRCAPGAESIMRLADARDMVCDGRFESIVAGKTEFAFSFVPVPDAIEMALNRGRTYAMAGPVHATGLKASSRTAPPEELQRAGWDAFYQVFRDHYRLKLVEFYDGMLSRYGNLSRFCPSPLLSVLIDGCLDRGRDLTAGGARYKILAPLMCGMSTAIDSLWAIKNMVFSDEAVFTLPELTNCLICDWGYDMKEPFYSPALGADRIAVEAERFKKLRLYARSLPKFGQGYPAIDSFGRRVVRDLIQLATDVIRKPQKPVSDRLASLRERFAVPGERFEFVITPGVGTFEDFAGVGSFLGASADGRRSGDAVASDFSASPTPADLPVPLQGRDARRALQSWDQGPADDDYAKIIDPIGLGLSNGAPVDINIRENFPAGELVELIRDFARGNLGSNMLSITCADPDTMAAAQRYPGRYDLLRVRMGGWSEFFAAMFPHLQEQHRRRPIFEAVASNGKP
jgi:pyruvate-formate lyase/deferrochelatase/peroxidase EfeB